MSFHPTSANDHIPPLLVNEPAGFGRVALAVGGDSAEREVSLDGGRSVGAAMDRLGIDYKIYDGGAALIDGVREGHVDRVFNLIHGPGGEDGSLQGALQLLDVPVTGSDLPSSALTMDKVYSKWIWEGAGISTPPFEIFTPEQNDFERAASKFGFPLFVKPSELGSSIGISRVECEEELEAAVALARQYGDIVIMEPEVAGSEYFCAVLGRMTLPIIRIETPRAFYDYEAKYESDETRYHCPCGLDSEIEIRLREKALEAFDVLGASGWGRVDFLLDSDGTAWFLEVNTIPGMTDHSLVPQEAAQVGIDFDELVWRILETSL
ncbi:MAG TPA: D-alanine--D-alanine ligase [Xanthomonadales bacterium]|nr:D-alanine--D-alanine ligase [Xanthomonadales bacterium]